MDGNDSNESINETSNDSNECNESDNKLTQYMLINKELSKTLVVLRAENARLRNNNKELNLQNLTYSNELTSNRSEIMKWRRKFTNLQAMHIQHVETLTTELQSYANKLTDVFDCNDDENGENEVTEQHHAIVKSPSNIDDRKDVLPRNSKSSTEMPKPNTKQPDEFDDNPANLNTINEDDEEVTDADDSDQISLVTSTHESTVADDTTTAFSSSSSSSSSPESVSESEDTKTLIAQNSMSDSSEMASMGSSKENEQPSSFLSPKLSITNAASPLTIDNRLQTIKQSITPLKEKFVTQRRTQKRKTEQNSLLEGNPKTPELISSTPYKRKRSVSHSELSTPSKQAIASPRMTRRTTITYSSSGRPKRSVCPVNFVEPKLNTKLRRPRTYEK